MFFICFSHLVQSFTFKFADKISLLFTIVFLFSLFLFSFCFYLLIFKYLRKNSSHFAEHTYKKSAGFWYKALNLSIRSVLRAAIFYFLHYYYRSQLIMLILMEILMIGCTITLQSFYKIFWSKFMYILKLSYSLLFILLNLALLAEDLGYDSSVILVLEKFSVLVIYLLIFSTILMMAIDTLPVCRGQKHKNEKAKAKVKNIIKLKIGQNK